MGHTMGMMHPSDSGRDCNSMVPSTGGDSDPWSNCGIDDFVAAYENKQWGAGCLECLDGDDCPVSLIAPYNSIDMNMKYIGLKFLLLGCFTFDIFFCFQTIESPKWYPDAAMCLIKNETWLGMEENGDGDWFCDPQNNRAECNYDGGDCCLDWGYDNGIENEPTSEWHWDLRCSGTLADNTMFWRNPVETPRSKVSAALNVSHTPPSLINYYLNKKYKFYFFATHCVSCVHVWTPLRLAPVNLIPSMEVETPTMIGPIVPPHPVFWTRCF